MTLSITGSRSELGRILALHSAPQARRRLHVNLAGQQANTLLHDGHAWAGFARRTLAGTRRAMHDARAERAGVFVHASFAFVHAFERGGGVDAPLRAAVDAILECEALALSGPIPACVVRLGYLYGPGSADLRAYRAAFQLARPYWSGPSNALQYHLHQFDAVSALLAAGRLRNAGTTFYATPGPAVSFGSFMDAFAHRVGCAKPRHLPLFARPLARVIIREEHMQQTALSMPPGTPAPCAAHWKPRYPDYRKGLDEVIANWGD